MDSSFYKFQSKVNINIENVPSHKVIEDYIAKYNEDYRFETAENPIEELRNRTSDNTTVGRITK